MKKETHPPYQEVLFVDSSTGTQFIIGSTIQAKDKQMVDGKEYPLVKVPISSASHPFFTKSNQFIDSEGRVERFANKYKRKSEEIQKAQVSQEEAKKLSAKKGKAKK